MNAAVQDDEQLWKLLFLLNLPESGDRAGGII